MSRRPQVKKIGEIRQSQALLTFGTGAVVDFQFHSAMPLGLDFWPARNKCQVIHEPDLERLVDKRWFQAPPVADQENTFPALLPACRFPRWLYCPECSAIGMAREVSNESPEISPEFGERFAFESLNGGKAKCTRTNGNRQCRGVGVPTRLVVVCHHDAEGPEPDHPGHIDDFPWYAWAHRKVSDEAAKVEPQPLHYMHLKTLGGSLAIDDLIVSCSCGVKEPLRGVFADRALKGTKRCEGWRPWLENRRDAKGCARPLKVFLRGATNIHLPVSTSVISIPPYTDSLAEALDEYVDELRSRWEDDCEDRAEQNLPPPELENFSRRQLRRLREQGFDREKSFTDDTCVMAILDRLRGESASQDPRITPSGRRFAECEALRRGESNPRGNFDAHAVEVPETWRSYLDRIVKVHRLREVTALQGFRRISRENPDIDSAKAKFASISRGPMQWLPAIELRGEGIFIELNLERVREWELRTAVDERMEPLRSNFLNVAVQEGWNSSSCPSARFVLVHTIAHLLIRQLTLECGYSSASLRERLYVAEPNSAMPPTCPGGEMAGFLIYTSTSDADGSLGGLVRMGDPDRLVPVLQEALRTATWCSSDPVCSTTSGQGHMGLNRAACHACALVPETSCERNNGYQDRVLVIPPRGFSPAASFFDADNLD
ncbi:MAG: DUF1998 domain-containing protein [Planctomycetia bacterium]|nr:DUF1998 domain-containing protein [Planctomycetia bacterium]